MRTGPETYERKGDADKALVLIEAQMSAGEWTDPERGKVKLADYASAWITERPGLRPRTADLYRWLLGKHIMPYLGGVPAGKLSTPARSASGGQRCLRNGVSVSVAAKAYRLLRAILMTAVEEDRLLSRNPCRIRGAGDEKTRRAPGADRRPGLRAGRGVSAVARSAISANCQQAVTGSGSAATA